MKINITKSFYLKPLLFISLFSVVRAHFKLQTKIMCIFSYYFKVFQIPLSVVSFIKNHFHFLTLNTKIIYKYKSFLSYIMQKVRLLKKTLLQSVRYDSKNNKYAFRITMLEKETTLNKVSILVA